MEQFKGKAFWVTVGTRKLPVVAKDVNESKGGKVVVIQSILDGKEYSFLKDEVEIADMLMVKGIKTLRKMLSSINFDLMSAIDSGFPIGGLTVFLESVTGGITLHNEDYKLDYNPINGNLSEGNFYVASRGRNDFERAEKKVIDFFNKLCELTSEVRISKMLITDDEDGKTFLVEDIENKGEYILYSGDLGRLSDIYPVVSESGNGRMRLLKVSLK